MDQYAGSPGHSTYCYKELAASFINFLQASSIINKQTNYQTEMLMHYDTTMHPLITTYKQH